MIRENQGEKIHLADDPDLIDSGTTEQRRYGEKHGRMVRHRQEPLIELLKLERDSVPHQTTYERVLAGLDEGELERAMGGDRGSDGLPNAHCVSRLGNPVGITCFPSKPINPSC